MGSPDSPTSAGVASKSFKPERVMRPREQVEEQLKHAIISGQFVNGEKLPSEAELAEQFSVSRATVREGLRSLASMGLITKIPGASGGSFVRTVNHEALSDTIRESMDNILRLGTIELKEAAGVRRMLEIPSVRLAAGARSEENLEEMRNLLAAHREAPWDDPGISQLDISFHRTIAEASGNRLLYAFVTALHLASQPVFYLDMNAERSESVLSQHQAIFEGIEAKDPDRAAAGMEAHLDYITTHSRSALP